MKVSEIYKKILFEKKVKSSIWNAQIKQVFIILLLNVAFHSIFSLEVFFQSSYPFYKILLIPDKYYYLAQAILLFPISFQVYLLQAAVIYLVMYKKCSVKFEDILKICIFTIGIPIAVIFAIPCILLYLLLGYKLAVFVPFFSLAAFVFGYLRLYKYLCMYSQTKVKYLRLYLFIALIFSFAFEGILVR